MDQTQTTIQRGMEEIKLGRVGHYNYQRVCQTALVVNVSEGDPVSVNLTVWNHTGSQSSRTSVPVTPPTGSTESFHLNRDCPDQR